jgi:hypothetical protein
MNKSNDSYETLNGIAWATTRRIVQKYLEDQSEERKEGIKELSTNELLKAQHSMKIWEAFLKTKDLFFIRYVCAKVHHLSQRDIGNELGLSAKAAHDLLHEVLDPKNHLTLFKLAILFNIPWQVIFKEKPIEITFQSYSEYYCE